MSHTFKGLEILQPKASSLHLYHQLWPLWAIFDPSSMCPRNTKLCPSRTLKSDQLAPCLCMGIDDVFVALSLDFGVDRVWWVMSLSSIWMTFWAWRAERISHSSKNQKKPFTMAMNGLHYASAVVRVWSSCAGLFCRRIQPLPIIDHTQPFALMYTNCCNSYTSIFDWFFAT